MTSKKLAAWQDKHTAWNSWEDLSRRELFRYHNWHLVAGEDDMTPPFRAGATGAQTCVLTHVSATQLGELQLVRRLVRRLGMQPVHWCCVVQLLPHNASDPLTQGNDHHNHHAQLVLRMLRQELGRWGNVSCEVCMAKTALEARLCCEQLVHSPLWSRAPLRLVAPVADEVHPAHQQALRRGLAFEGYGGYGLKAWPAPVQEHEKRHEAGFLRGGGLYLLDDEQISRPALQQRLGLTEKKVRLWLFYMDDEVPTAAQLAGSQRQHALPFPAQAGAAPGEAMAFFINEFVRKAKGKSGVLNVVLAPHLTAGAVRKPAKNVTVMSYKGQGPVQSLLRHCEDWVGCEGLHTLAECCRAGKRIFFRHRSGQERAVWEQYQSSLAQHLQSNAMEYRTLAEKASRAKLRAFGESRPSLLQSLKVAV
jgi:hypothetical protein